jgi:hypothetical protein
MCMSVSTTFHSRLLFKVLFCYGTRLAPAIRVGNQFAHAQNVGFSASCIAFADHNPSQVRIITLLVSSTQRMKKLKWYIFCFLLCCNVLLCVHIFLLLSSLCLTGFNVRGSATNLPRTWTAWKQISTPVYSNSYSRNSLLLECTRTAYSDLLSLCNSERSL